ncbi:MAG: hypothetical protein NTW73_03345, partial [Candidatus Parcubacteria bacterium]|nr:hypothetical protein [Candidatus Parcubacteria bacterium]
GDNYSCNESGSSAGYTCSRCSDTKGCAMATWQNKTSDCVYSLFDLKNPPTYVTNSKECSKIDKVGADNSRCPGSTTPSIETCASKGGTCKDYRSCSNTLGTYNCTGTTVCCKSVTTPPATTTCASKGGSCIDTWLCSSGSWGALDCVGSTKTCCKLGSTGGSSGGTIFYNYLPSPIKMTLGPLQWLTASLVEIFR